MRNQIEVEFESGPTAAAAARAALVALHGQVEDTLLDDVRLLVSELVTNSVRHAHAGIAGEVHMAVQLTAGKLRVEVADTGEGFEPQPRDDDRSRPGGWGLYLVDQLADRWGVVCDRFTRVWFELDADRSARA